MVKKLSSPDVLRRFPFLASAVTFAESSLLPEKIILFGSRARGDHHDRSDVDLAFSGVDEKKWSRFVVDFPDHCNSLLSFDLVNLDTASLDLAENVSREGILIYEYQNSTKDC